VEADLDIIHMMLVCRYAACKSFRVMEAFTQTSKASLVD
jgi:hypothetical protein